MEKHGMAWHQKNINGTGAFSFVQHQPGAFVEGKARPGYHHMGSDGKPLPYLDGYKAISAPKMAVRVQAIRGDRAAIEFKVFRRKLVTIWSMPWAIRLPSKRATGTA